MSSGDVIPCFTNPYFSAIPLINKPSDGIERRILNFIFVNKVIINLKCCLFASVHIGQYSPIKVIKHSYISFDVFTLGFPPLPGVCAILDSLSSFRCVYRPFQARMKSRGREKLSVVSRCRGSFNIRRPFLNFCKEYASNVKIRYYLRLSSCS